MEESERGFSYLKDEQLIRYYKTRIRNLERQVERYKDKLKAERKKNQELRSDITLRKREILAKLDEYKEDIKDIMYVEVRK